MVRKSWVVSRFAALWPWFYRSRSIWFISWHSAKPDHWPNLTSGRSRGAASESSEAHMWHTRSASGQKWEQDGERGGWGGLYVANKGGKTQGGDRGHRVSTSVNYFYIITSVKCVLWYWFVGPRMTQSKRVNRFFHKIWKMDATWNLLFSWTFSSLFFWQISSRIRFFYSELKGEGAACTFIVFLCKFYRVPLLFNQFNVSIVWMLHWWTCTFTLVKEMNQCFYFDKSIFSMQVSMLLLNHTLATSFPTADWQMVQRSFSLQPASVLNSFHVFLLCFFFFFASPLWQAVMLQTVDRLSDVPLMGPRSVWEEAASGGKKDS